MITIDLTADELKEIIRCLKTSNCNPALVQKLDSLAFVDHLALAAKVVESWPAWKRNLLENSSKPTMSTPRTPIVPND
jgi:hypothetical protein